METVIEYGRKSVLRSKMKYTGKLFRHRNAYDLKGTDALFVSAMKENALFQYNNCSDYKRILAEKGFDPSTINEPSDLARLPFIPTLYFKHHELSSIPRRKQFIKATSSGTGGSMSRIGFDLGSVLRAGFMSMHVGRYHKLWSIKPSNYIIFGYQPTKSISSAYL